MKRFLTRLGCWVIGTLVFGLRASCRFRAHHDPRPRIIASGGTYVYAVLHAHQLAAVMAAERGCGAMVSRSADGDMLIPLMRMCGLVPVRGSGSGGSRRPGKGGVSALQALIRHVRGGQPATLAVDGPKGPRGQVQRGIAMLSQKTGVPVVTVVLVPKHRWILGKTWDRTQIPIPFTRVDGYFGPELISQEGESLEDFSLRIQDVLNGLDAKHDPQEAAANEPNQRALLAGRAKAAA